MTACMCGHVCVRTCLYGCVCICVCTCAVGEDLNSSTLLKFKLSYFGESHSSFSLLPLLVDNSVDCSSCSVALL